MTLAMPMPMTAPMTATIPPDQIQAIRRQFLSRCIPTATPVIYCMAGIPGAGKSTYVNAAMARGDFPADAFILNPDRVMEALPAYHADAAVLGAVAAFEKWEMPCRTLAYAMVEDAEAMRATIIKDMGSARQENYDMLARLKSAGYRVHITYLECDIETALARIKTRPRHTPPAMVIDRARSLAALLPLYRDLADEFITVAPPSP